MQKRFVYSLTVTGIVLSSSLAPANAALFSQAFVFGDSISDAGLTFSLTGGMAPPSPPYAGRLSNGPVWVEYLQNSLGLTSSLATNFAVAGATTGTQNTTSPLLPGIAQQVGGFLAGNPSADSNALYILYGGANDYLGGGQTNPNIAIDNLGNYITALYGAGARNFLVPNLPDLGKLPGTLPPNPNSLGLGQLSIAHNTLLANRLGTLSTTLPGSKITSLDFFSLFTDAITRPSEYGFTNVTQGCLLTSEPGVPVLPVQVCSNPNEYLFWDVIHPTTRTHQILGEFAASALGVPEPSTVLGLLAVGLIGAGARLTKKP